jgi:hypothetical protein
MFLLTILLIKELKNSPKIPRKTFIMIISQIFELNPIINNNSGKKGNSPVTICLNPIFLIEIFEDIEFSKGL